MYVFVTDKASKTESENNSKKDSLEQAHFII